MGKIRKSRKIVITVFLILTVVATGIAAFCSYKSSTSGMATDINDVVENGSDKFKISKDKKDKDNNEKTDNI